MGIIGGSGLSDLDILLNKTVKSVDTPYGKVIRLVICITTSVGKWDKTGDPRELVYVIAWAYTAAPETD